MEYGYKFLWKKRLNFGYIGMEKSMKDYIVEEYERYKKCALQFDEESFMNDVLKSFMDAKTYHHYVLLVACDLNEYFSTNEHLTFERLGYYQQPIDERYSNRFFIPIETIKHAVNIVKDDNMCVEQIRLNEVDTYVVTVNGIHDSFYSQDFSPQIGNNNKNI